MTNFTVALSFFSSFFILKYLPKYNSLVSKAPDHSPDLATLWLVTHYSVYWSALSYNKTPSIILSQTV